MFPGWNNCDYCKILTFQMLSFTLFIMVFYYKGKLYLLYHSFIQICVKQYLNILPACIGFCILQENYNVKISTNSVSQTQRWFTVGCPAALFERYSFTYFWLLSHPVLIFLLQYQRCSRSHLKEYWTISLPPKCWKTKKQN